MELLWLIHFITAIFYFFRRCQDAAMLQRQEYKLKNSSFLPMKICSKQGEKTVQKSCVLVDKTKNDRKF